MGEGGDDRMGRWGKGEIGKGKMGEGESCIKT